MSVSSSLFRSRHPWFCGMLSFTDYDAHEMLYEGKRIFFIHETVGISRWLGLCLGWRG